MATPKPGTRITENGRTLEWTGDAWTPVCPACDVPMDAHDHEAWLCCGTCGLRAVDR